MYNRKKHIHVQSLKGIRQILNIVLKYLCNAFFPSFINTIGKCQPLRRIHLILCFLLHLLLERRIPVKTKEIGKSYHTGFTDTGFLCQTPYCMEAGCYLMRQYVICNLLLRLAHFFALSGNLFVYIIHRRTPYLFFSKT